MPEPDYLNVRLTVKAEFTLRYLAIFPLYRMNKIGYNMYL